MIRQRLAQGADVSELLPEGVIRHLGDHDLYSGQG